MIKQFALSFLLFASAAFGQNYGPGATIFYNGFPPPTLGTSCAGLPSGFAGYVTSNGIIQTCSGTPPVWTQQAILPIGSSQLQSTSVVGSSALQVCYAKYSFAADGGTVGLITPQANCTIPANSIIYNEIIQWGTAATGTGATATIGTTGTGGGAAILQAIETVGSGLSGIVQGVIVPQTASGFKKLTTAGQVTLTVGTANLTGGTADIWVMYIASPD